MYPTRLALFLLFIPACTCLVLVFDDTWLPALLLLDGVIALIIAADALFGVAQAKHFALEQEVGETWSHGREESVTYHLDHKGRLGRKVTVTPDLPAHIRLDHQEPREQELRLPGMRRATLHFPLVATERGVHELGGLCLASTSRLGLWRRHFTLGTTHDIHVYPNLKQLGEYALLARTDRLSLIGVRSVRRVGGDTEFERLRDYQSDDPLSRIDWKATARRDDLTVRDYQINQSQVIMLMIDCGRMMVSRFYDEDGNEAGTLLDQAIDTCLMLAFVALKQGDRVGLIAYADGVKRFVPATGGQRQLNRLIHAVHDLQATMVESRHDEAFMHLQKTERKRALVVCATHILDDVNSAMLKKHLRQLGSRHLPMAIILRDPDIERPLKQAPADQRSLYHAGAAALISSWRSHVINDLIIQGTLVIDCEADQLTPTVVNRYLEVKARHLL